MNKDLLEGNRNVTSFTPSAFSNTMNSESLPPEPGLISTVQHKLEDLVNRLDGVNTDLEKIYTYIFGNDLKNVDGENFPEPNKSLQQSPNISIINKFRDVNALLDSINETILRLNSSL